MSRLVLRSEWGGIPASFDRLPTPVSTLFLHHTVTSAAQALVPAMRDLEAHALALGHRAIDYSLVHFAYGARAEGRGYFAVGGHTLNWNSRSLGLSCTGDYRFDTITEALLDELAQSIRDGIALGAVAPGYVLRPHSDVFATACPARLSSVIPEINRRVASGGGQEEPEVRGIFIKRPDQATIWFLVNGVRIPMRSFDQIQVLTFIGQAVDARVHAWAPTMVESFPIYAGPTAPANVTVNLTAAQIRAAVRAELAELVLETRAA